MIQTTLRLKSNFPLTASVNKMLLEGKMPRALPGQFAEIRIPGLFLRRPISICDQTDSTLTLIYKTVGSGTEKMAKMQKEEKIDLLLPLGNGYDLEDAGKKPLLIGGGVGVPPMFLLCKALILSGKTPDVILGFNTRDEIFYEEEFRSLGANVAVTTVDGTAGKKGFVTDALNLFEFDSVFSCGPVPMLKAVSKVVNVPCQFSLEERMGCGFGACMGCSIQTKNGAKRVCKDGPVFRKEDLLWQI